MKALHDGYNVGTADLALLQASKIDSINQPQRTKAPEVESPAAIARKARITAAMVRFEALPPVEQDRVVGEFHQAAVIHQRLKPGSMMFKKTLGNWMVDHEDKPIATLLE